MEHYPDGVGARIRGIRRNLGLTQAELAALAGVQGLTISRAELGRSRTQVDILDRIARALDVSLDWLVRGADGCDSQPRESTHIPRVRVDSADPPSGETKGAA